MARRLMLLALVFVLPAPSFAASASLQPEQLLAGDSVVYFRYDGVEAHRKAFDQTIMGEMMRGELGEFIEYLTTISRDAIGPTILKDRLLRGKPAAGLQHLRRGFNQSTAALNYLGRHGFVLGFEVIATIPPRVQLTIVFPNGADAKHRAALDAGFRLFAAMSGAAVVENQNSGRTFSLVDAGVAKIGWWTEGPHLVMTIGTEKPERTLELVDKKRRGLLDHPLYKEVSGFKKYETLARGFVETEKYLKMLNVLPPPANMILDQLGIEELKSVTFHFGVEGRNLRSTLALKIPGKRSGLLGMLTANPIQLDKLPPLPPDASSIYVLNVNPGELFDRFVEIVQAGAAAAGADEKKQAQEAFQALDERLGVNLRKDVLEHLGPRVVLYNSPSEGPLSLGLGLFIDVKDEKKLKTAIEIMMKSLPQLLGDKTHLKKESHAGVEIYSLHSSVEGFYFVPSFTVYGGRLAVGLFPQTVRGYLKRAAGKLSSWTPTPLVASSLEAARKAKLKVVAVNVSDPRPTMQQLCSIGPILGAMANSNSPGVFDVKRIPTTQSMTEPLFPNVTLFTDDGETLTMDGRASFALPLFDLSGMDTYFVVLVGYQLLRIGF